MNQPKHMGTCSRLIRHKGNPATSVADSGEHAQGSVNEQSRSLGWCNFIHHVQKDFKLTAACLFTLFAFRFFLITYFHSRFSAGTEWRDILLAFFVGLRFDVSVASIITIPTLLLGIASSFAKVDQLADRIRKIISFLFLGVSSLVFVANFLFIYELHDNFNHWIFGIIYDDFLAVVKSMMKDYPLTLYFSVSLTAFITMSFLTNHLLNNHNANKLQIAKTFSTYRSKITVTALVIFILVASLRGSIGNRPVQLKDASVTKDEFLNKMILNPYFAIKYALKENKKLTSAAGLTKFLPSGDINNAIETFFNAPRQFVAIDDYMKKSAKGNPGAKPQHIFFIVMESLDSWSLLDRYQSFNLLPNIKRLGEQGVLLTSFLPAADGTMPSLSAIVTGLPEVGVHTSIQPSSTKPYATSIAPQFKKLGFKTNFFYGGYLSWQKVGDFCKLQGFDHIYGGAQMGPWQNREWGVNDDALYQFIRDNIKADEPTFNLILTTSYHSPYDLPVYREGFPYQNIPKDLENAYDNRSVPLSVFGHLWYTDKMLGEFISAIENKLPGCVFAVTGDHWSKKHISTTPSLYEKTSVPLLLYGKGILPSTRQSIAGSHLDIMPTLIELSAPQGFAYHSIGVDLFSADRKNIGFGKDCVITDDYIMDSQGKTERLPFAAHASGKDATGETLQLFKSYQGIGWWRIMKGSQIAPGHAQPSPPPPLQEQNERRNAAALR